MRVALAGAATVAACLLAGPAAADDPLDHVDGTEGWDEMDSSALDRSAAWRQWRRDLRRWEAGRARLRAERAQMARHEAPAEEEATTTAGDGAEDHQARIERARAETEGLGPARRDEEGQSLDDERPWSQR